MAATDVDPLPTPRVHTIGPDPDRPGDILIQVECPNCWRIHTHQAHAAERVIDRIPHCQHRLGINPRPYTIHLSNGA